MMDGRVVGAYHQVLGFFSALSRQPRWAGGRDSAAARPAGILKPFARTPRRWYVPNRFWFFVPLLLLFCLIYGFAFALLAPFVVVPFAVPLIFLLLLVIWAMPDAAAPVRTMNFLFFAFFIGLIAWPNYLAISLPGLPWISIIRLTAFPLTLIFLYCVSVSHEFRRTLAATINSEPYIWKALVAVACIQTISVAFSAKPFASLNRLVVVQTEWTAIFFISCYLFLKPGRATWWAACLWCLGLLVSAIGILEARLGYIPWRNHIPSVFQIDDPVVQTYLAGAQRSVLGVHRVQSVFTTSLTLSEFLALTIPFVIHFMRTEFNWKIRAIAMLTVPFFLYMILLTQARLGFVGFLVTLMSVTFIWAVRQRRANKRNPFWTAIVAGYPIIFGAAVAATFFVGRLRVQVWGGGAQQFSTQSRIEQYHLGIPKILTHPWGYGLTMANETLGFVDSSGTGTIDTFYLTVGLEYGVIGFIVFFGMILLALYVGGKDSIAPAPLKGEAALLIPITISLLNFFVIKSVFSQQDNHPIIFMLLGMLMALVWRLRNTTEMTPTPKPTRRR